MEIQKPERRALISLLISVFLAGTSWAAMVPLWQTPDEQAHFAQAQDYAAVGYRPNLGASTSQDIVISEKLLGTFRDERGNNKFTYHPEYRPPYSNSTIGFNEKEIVNLPVAMRKIFLINEASGYPPLYYWYIALINKLIWGQDLITRVFASRMATVIISTAGILAVYGVGREVFVGRTAALAAAAVWGFMPMRQFVGSGVTSDALMNAVYPIALFCLIKLAVKPSKKYFWLAIVAAGVAMGVKLQSIFLVPIWVVAFVAANRNRHGLGKWERRIGKLAIATVSLIMLVTIMGHIRFFANRFPRLFGFLFFPEVVNFSDLYSRPTVVEYIKVTAVELYRQGIPWYFGVYRWLSLTLPIWIYRAIKIVLLLSALGWIAAAMKKSKGLIRWRQLKLVIFSAGFYAVGLLTWNFFYWKSHGFSLGIQGRYFFPNLAEHMILLMGGLIAIGRLIALVIPAQAGIYLNRFRIRSGMTGERLMIFALVLGMVIFNWYSWWFVAASYFDAGNFQTFFLQASQYKPWFFKWPFLPGIIILGVISSGWFLWEMVGYTRTQEHENIKTLEH